MDPLLGCICFELQSYQVRAYFWQKVKLTNLLKYDIIKG